MIRRHRGPAPAETVEQAERHDWNTGRYVELGLCPRCSAQAAWGHQAGWHRVHQPCPTCRAVVASFPDRQVNGWRSVAPTE